MSIEGIKSYFRAIMYLEVYNGTMLFNFNMKEHICENNNCQQKFIPRVSKHNHSYNFCSLYCALESYKKYLIMKNIDKNDIKLLDFMIMIIIINFEFSEKKYKSLPLFSDKLTCDMIKSYLSNHNKLNKLKYIGEYELRNIANLCGHNNITEEKIDEYFEMLDDESFSDEKNENENDKKIMIDIDGKIEL
jgi:hypothetical protein